MIYKIFKKRYAIHKQISKNAGRRTFLARDLKNKKWVVIKLLIFGENFQWEELKLFEREAETLKRISHPAIPRYLDCFDLDTSSGKGFALVQSYIPAKSLEKWLKSGRRFSEENVKQLAQALLKILCFLQEQNPPIIHRDIKPSNILLSNRSGNSIGQVYLVDFGSVKTLAANKGSTITVVGTYGYMPPEQFGGQTIPASDLYSLGATLIYIVTGRHPAELPQENLRIQFESFVNLSSDLIDWLKWMTQPSLNRRLASATEALKVLERSVHRTDDSTVGEKSLLTTIKRQKYRENIPFKISQNINIKLKFCITIILLFWVGSAFLGLSVLQIAMIVQGTKQLADLVFIIFTSLFFPFPLVLIFGFLTKKMLRESLKLLK